MAGVTLRAGIFTVALLFCGAAGEEIAFRGFPLQMLMRGYGSWASIAGMGVLFGLMHHFNPGSTTLSTVNTAGFGVLFGFALLRSHDLWLPIGIHFGWNAALPFLGVPLSGFTIRVTEYQLVWKAGVLWSGGTYGPEASLLASLRLLAMTVAVWRMPVRKGWAWLLDAAQDSGAARSSTRRVNVAFCISLLFRPSGGSVHPADRLTEDERIRLLRDLSSEYANAKVAIPRSKKPLEFNADGTYDKMQWHDDALTMGRRRGSATRFRSPK